MDFNEYQKLAARTINKDLLRTQNEMHALHGMVGEIGELHSLYQKVYQGHGFDKSHAIKEAGDIMWFIAEWCTAIGINLDEVAVQNIEKLKARYPEGFDKYHSLHRKKVDV